MATTVLAAAFLGLWCLFNLPVDSFPDVSNVQVQIITELGSMPAEEVEPLVTFPIENGLNGLPNISLVRSNSSFGLSVVTAIFDDNTDIYWARQIVQQRLNQIELPEGTPTPQLGPVISTFSNVFNYYLESDKLNLTELRTLQDWVIARQLRAVPGVGNVVSYGGFVKQYQVIFSPHTLKSYGLTLKDLLNALASNNSNAGGNFIEQSGEEIIVRGIGRIQSVSDIADIVLKSVHGTPVKVGNVAEVTIGAAFRRGSASMNGNGEVVTGMVFTRKGVNSKEVVERVRQRIAELNKELPPGVKILTLYDQSSLVDKTIETVKEILFFSGALVVIVLAAILLDIRCALIVAVIIPLSLLFSFILMKVTGLSANLMTLGAVDFGVIVDAGVVMVENIYRRLALAWETEGNKPPDTLGLVLAAAQEVGRPIVFAISIIISVYLPLFTLIGIEGRMFKPLALTFIYALLGALLVSLMVIPVLCLWSMKNKVSEKRNAAMDSARKFCASMLEQSLNAPIKTVAISMIALAISLCFIPFLGSEFMPTLDEGSILLRTRLSPSISHTESHRIATAVENIIKRYPEVDIVATRIGRAPMGTDLKGVECADVYIGLKPRSWTTAMSKEALINKMAKDLDGVPGLVYSFSQPIADMVDDLVAGIRADLGIKIFGEDLSLLDQLASAVEKAVAKVPGAVDMQREHILGLPQLIIKLKRDVIARYGLNVEDVQEVIETAIAGKVVTEIIEDTKRFGLLVRLPKAYRETPEAIQSLLVDTPDGGHVPLKHIADIRMLPGIFTINRENGQRRIAVLANVRGRDLGSFVEEAQAAVKKQVTIPTGYRIQWAGQFENEERAMARLSIVVPIVLILIFVFLFASFNSVKNALLVMLNVPFAMIGGILALLISHQPLSVPAVIGFIAVFGVAVQNGVILVSHIMSLQRQEIPLVQAVEEGVAVRMRPVLMTALVAIVGLLPKILSTGTGAEIQRPLATVVLGGLVSATALTLIVLPTVFVLVNSSRRSGPSASSK